MTPGVEERHASTPEREDRRPSWARVAVAVVLTGVLAGVAGSVLTLALHLVQHLAFGYTENTFLVGVEQAPAWRRVLSLAVAGVVVAPLWWLHHRSGDVEDVSVTGAVRSADPRMPLLRTAADGVLQVVAVGAGASLGREGAPRQVGAALAARAGVLLGVTVGQRRTLLACGAGAGLAAVYDVPLAGAVFALEILLASVAVTDVVAALAVCAVATVVAWPFLGSATTYEVTGFRLTWALVVWAAAMGPLVGLLGAGFVRLMTASRTRAPQGAGSIPAIVLAFALLGAAAIAYPALLGNGKGPADLAFTGALSLGGAAALTVLKPLATALCLRSGAVGGLLTPALATGATMGIVTGRLWDHLWAGTPLVDFAVVASAALLAVTQRAPLTAVVLTLELVGGGTDLLVPMVLCVALACVVAWRVDTGLAPLALRARFAPARGVAA